jgi:hypothetical protein
MSHLISFVGAAFAIIEFASKLVRLLPYRRYGVERRPRRATPPLEVLDDNDEVDEAELAKVNDVDTEADTFDDDDELDDVDNE